MGRTQRRRGTGGEGGQGRETPPPHLPLAAHRRADRRCGRRVEGCAPEQRAGRARARSGQERRVRAPVCTRVAHATATAATSRACVPHSRLTAGHARGARARGRVRACLQRRAPAADTHRVWQCRRTDGAVSSASRARGTWWDGRDCMGAVRQARQLYSRRRAPTVRAVAACAAAGMMPGSWPRHDARHR